MRINSLSVEQSLASLNASAAGVSANLFPIILWIGPAPLLVADHFDPGQGTALLGLATACGLLMRLLEDLRRALLHRTNAKD